jgi:nucleoside-diphosphate-sugar epimerase
MKISITGSTGFVGTNLHGYLRSFHELHSLRVRYLPYQNVNLTSDGVVHLSGKADDLKNVSNPQDYYQDNFELTKQLFDSFLVSKASFFIYMSSVKASVEEVEGELNEEHVPKPITHYGRSKLLAEQYILSKEIPEGRRVYVLRPCMIHGPVNKGNLNLLYKLVSKGLPWPLGAFKNNRSFCSIDNLMFIIKELIERDDIKSGVYNVADDVPLSINDVISILAESQNRKPRIWNISKGLIVLGAKIGNVLKLPLNEERLHKLTNSYVVSNKKLMSAICKALPVSSREGLLKTFQSFQ